MKSDDYSRYFTQKDLMGPNSMRLIEEMLSRHTDAIGEGARVLDLGCGGLISTLFIAKETRAASIFATDLWISATDNLRRANEWGIADKVIPMHADANDMPYADGFFDAVISVDAYHYFGREPGFFEQKILPLVKPGGSVLIAVPGVKREPDAIPPIMTEWAQDEASYFHSCEW